MTQSRLISAIVFGALTLATQARALVWLSEIHDFGAFAEDMGRVTCTFRAVNVSPEPVSIVGSRANCGCTVPGFSKEPVAPGDTMVINVTYDPSGRPGRFHKKVFIDTSDGEKMTLGVHGTVIASEKTRLSRFPIQVGQVGLGNKYIAFGSTIRGRMLSGGLNIYNSTDHPITPSLSGLPSYMHAAFKPTVIPVGEVGFLTLTGYTDRQPDYGTVEGSFLLTPDSSSPADSIRINTTMIVREDFSSLTPEQLERAPKARLSTECIDFDRIKGSAPVTLSLTLTNDGREPLIIRRIDTYERAITWRLTPAKRIAPGKSAKLEVTLSPKLLPADDSPLNARIQLIVNDPSNPNISVRVVGLR